MTGAASGRVKLMRSSAPTDDQPNDWPECPARPLGYGEQLWMRLSEGASNNALLVARLEGSLDPDRLYRALRHTMAARPILRARVAYTAGSPLFDFSGGKTPPLRQIPRQDDHHWQRLAEVELDQGIHPGASLLWRVTLLQGQEVSELIFSYNHGIADGHSVQWVLDGVLRCYAADDNVLTPQGPPVNYEHFLPSPPAARLFASALVQLFRQSVAARREQISLPASSRPRAGRQAGTRFQVLSLDRITSQRLMEAGKARGESIHGVLGSLFLTATRDATGSRPVTTTLNMSAAANVRPLLQGDFSQEVGYFATGFESRFTLSPDTGLWDLASRVNRETQGQFQAGKVAVGVFIKRLILAFKRRPQGLLKAIARHNRTHIHFTNLGRMFVQPRYADLTVTRLMALPSVQFMARPMVCLESHYFSGSLQLTFSYPHPVTEADFVQRLVSRFEHLVHSLTSRPEFNANAEEEGKQDVATAVRT